MRNHSSHKNKEYYLIRNVTLSTIVINIILTLLKLSAGIYAHSTAMLADALHCASDIITSVGVIIGSYISKSPKDDCHPYGHGKAESITSFLLSLLLLMVGIQIGYKGMDAIVKATYRQPGSLALWAALLSIFLKELQYQISIRMGKKLNSTPLIADAWHHRSDALSSIGALLGILGARMGFPFLDPFVGIVIALVIIKIAIHLLRQSLKELMDTSLPSDNLKDISKVVLQTPYVLSIQEIKSRKYSNYAFVNISIGVNPLYSVKAGHDIAHKVEHNIQQYMDFPTEVHIHIEPYSHEKG